MSVPLPILSNTDFAGAVFDGGTLAACRWTNVRSATFNNYTFTGPVTLNACSNLSFFHCKFAAGVTIAQGDHIAVQRSELTTAGIYAQRMNYLSITENLFHAITAPDVINIPGCEWVDISWNAVWRPEPATGHPDFVQSFPMVNTQQKSVVISHNFVLGTMEGIFGVANFTAERNLLKLAYQNGIYGDVTSDAITIDTNTLASLSDGFAQATIINAGPKVTMRGENQAGPWTDATGHIHPAKSFPATVTP